MIDKIKQIVKQIINEATTNSTGSRGSYILPLKPGKRIFDKSQLGAYTTSVSKYYDQKLANDSYDGKMNTPKKEIDSLESKAKKISKYEKNNPLFSKDGKLNFVAGGIKNSNLNKISKPYDKKINEATSEIAGGLYNGPIELGMKKWEKNLLAPFIEFVDTDINHTKVKSTTKNNIKRIVGMWEKGKDGTYNVPTEYVHTMNEWKYEEAPILTEDLGVWFGTKKKPKGSKQPKGPWVDICRKVDGKHPPCGRSDADTKSYPKCRAAGVAGKMSDSEKKAACAQKRRAEKKEPKYGTGNKPTMVSYKPKNNSVNEQSVKDFIIPLKKIDTSWNNRKLGETPFYNQTEGDKFRKWVNDNHPDVAKGLQLDRSGKHNNAYIQWAWNLPIENILGKKSTLGDRYIEKETPSSVNPYYKPKSNMPTPNKIPGQFQGPILNITKKYNTRRVCILTQVKKGNKIEFTYSIGATIQKNKNGYMDFSKNEAFFETIGTGKINNKNNKINITFGPGRYLEEILATHTGGC